MSAFPVILSAPSGGGKTTIARALLQRRNDVGYSVSCTTRAPRPGELEGRDYYFLTRAEFVRRREAGEFAESAEVHGNLYGTLRTEVRRVMDSGRHVIMDIDVQGALQFTRAFPDSVTIFVLPPTAEVLLERLRQRQTESREQLARRLLSALQELQSIEQYQYIVVNDDLEQSIHRVSSIIDAEVVSRQRVAGLRHQVARLVERLEAEIDNQ
ncbi:MAG TPA: guanylate kinase [Gemmatimonadaceae bacterium]|nr:guanylate kinase [Gemmatimonadaceae bacterium]